MTTEQNRAHRLHMECHADLARNDLMANIHINASLKSCFFAVHDDIPLLQFQIFHEDEGPNAVHNTHYDAVRLYIQKKTLKK